ncbi:hypothetical protein [Gluconobacter wancherniae]|uniref:hypothetical protein n=1 Tax=Gluconobacter wancherniae TaxID=1307955 RepID=UPI001B8C1B1D|nr:hypothetical protein [Gluconobacter wancherniae]MBS1095410.1 hypothetical protein [Gluconobacter wancherniae]
MPQAACSTNAAVEPGITRNCEMVLEANLGQFLCRSDTPVEGGHVVAGDFPDKTLPV